MIDKPKGYKWHYYDHNDSTWKIKDEAPEWAKKEFKEFRKLIDGEESEDKEVVY